MTDFHLADAAAAYLTAAEWTAPDQNGQERDHNPGEFRSTARWDTDAWTHAIETVTAFVAMAGTYLLDRAGTPGQVGRDIWLTRNGHGAGFWDRGLGAAGDVLTAIAHDMGPIDAYVDDEVNLLVID